MINAFQQINECLGAAADVSKGVQLKKSKLNFGLLAGMTVYSVSNYFYPIENSFKPTAGIFFEIVPGKRLKNYMIRVDLTYQHASQPKEAPPAFIGVKFHNRI